jgi:hypothetical protein
LLESFEASGVVPASPPTGEDEVEEFGEVEVEERDMVG